ncbi:hypothetical protein, partial [Clostridium perfringens]
LDNLSHIEKEKVVEEAAEELEKKISDKAKTFSNTSYMYVGKGEKRVYGLSCFIDVGFSKDNAPFDLWKSLWFQNWGYFDKGLNFNGDIYINKHQFWFDETVKSSGKEIQKQLKEKLRQEVRNALR